MAKLLGANPDVRLFRHDNQAYSFHIERAKSMLADLEFDVPATIALCVAIVVVAIATRRWWLPYTNRNPITAIACHPGVYLFRDDSGYLYIGEAGNLRTRVPKHLDHSDRKALAHYFWEQGVTKITVELHAFDPESDARLQSSRRAYESELIDKRFARFNIRP